MRFITESILRDQYRKHPFFTYTLQEDERLTPGGRQFLVDRKIPFGKAAEAKQVKAQKRQKETTGKLDYCWNQLEIKLLKSMRLAEMVNLDLSQQLYTTVDFVRQLKDIKHTSNFSQFFPSVEKLEEKEIQLTAIQVLSQQGELLLELSEVTNLIKLLQVNVSEDKVGELHQLELYVKQKMDQLLGA